MMKIKLGDLVTDDVSTLAGIVTARAEYITGCVRYCVEPVATAGEIKESWIDEVRLSVVKAQVFRVPGQLIEAAPAGLRTAPARQSNPRR